MKLQLALDLFTVEECLEILDEVADLVDIVEAGTPLVLQYGVDVVKTLRDYYPQLEILADFKICDGGKHEADMAFNAGADIVTVMGFTNQQTIENVIRSARENKKKSCVDLMCVSDIVSVAKFYVSSGADYVCIHNATDALDFDDLMVALQQLSHAIDSSQISVAGGINVENIVQLRKYDPGILVVGRSVTMKSNRRRAILDLKERYCSG